jgi:hypothetical protein
MVIGDVYGKGNILKSMHGSKGVIRIYKKNETRNSSQISFCQKGFHTKSHYREAPQLLLDSGLFSKMEDNLEYFQIEDDLDRFQKKTHFAYYRDCLTVSYFTFIFSKPDSEMSWILNTKDNDFLHTCTHDSDFCSAQFPVLTFCFTFHFHYAY